MNEHVGRAHCVFDRLCCRADRLGITEIELYAE
jgi:hypothetical protein